MLFAFIYLVLQKRQVLSESKGEALFSSRISSLLLFLSVVSFIVRPHTLSVLRLWGGVNGVLVLGRAWSHRNEGHGGPVHGPGAAASS